MDPQLRAPGVRPSASSSRPSSHPRPESAQHPHQRAAPNTDLLAPLRMNLALQCTSGGADVCSRTLQTNPSLSSAPSICPPPQAASLPAESPSPSPTKHRPAGSAGPVFDVPPFMSEPHVKVAHFASGLQSASSVPHSSASVGPGGLAQMAHAQEQPWPFHHPCQPQIHHHHQQQQQQQQQLGYRQGILPSAPLPGHPPAPGSPTTAAAKAVATARALLAADSVTGRAGERANSRGALFGASASSSSATEAAVPPMCGRDSGLRDDCGCMCASMKAGISDEPQQHPVSGHLSGAAAQAAATSLYACAPGAMATEDASFEKVHMLLSSIQMLGASIPPSNVPLAPQSPHLVLPSSSLATPGPPGAPLLSMPPRPRSSASHALSRSPQPPTLVSKHPEGEALNYTPRPFSPTLPLSRAPLRSPPARPPLRTQIPSFPPKAWPGNDPALPQRMPQEQTQQQQQQQQQLKQLKQQQQQAVLQEALSVVPSMQEACLVLDMLPGCVDTMHPDLRSQIMGLGLNAGHGAAPLSDVLSCLPPNLLRLKAVCRVLPSLSGHATFQELSKLAGKLREVKADLNQGKAYDAALRLGLPKAKLKKLRPAGDGSAGSEFSQQLLMALETRLRAKLALSALKHKASKARTTDLLLRQASAASMAPQQHAVLLVWCELAAERRACRRTVQQHCCRR
ncbi:hypothetical protein DUNSADRAFT_5381 [Dunaliella salina]|uniref:Uncharacterized protein n=1 Tax=Dunaliella salina TaxID=3046 RepID=A0ABQ7GQC4_DUNSA|nr:hypothetical protein DUNSADRAFT_5381 [Dunaliella salina]|eukprot:KAF5836802.1 hypothetical protein DUNSADRAFT_5381 [Dunaliella salina]